jgi:hypothetical protein
VKLAHFAFLKEITVRNKSILARVYGKDSVVIDSCATDGEQVTLAHFVFFSSVFGTGGTATFKL